MLHYCSSIACYEIVTTSQAFLPYFLPHHTSEKGSGEPPLCTFFCVPRHFHKVFGECGPEDVLI